MGGLGWLVGVVGVVVGSFLNVCIDRLPHKRSIINPPSHCPGCQKRIPAYDLIPVLSYVILRGRCRNCGESIPVRVLIVEILTGMVFILVWIRFGLIWKSLPIYLISSLLIVITFIDIEHKKVLNLLVVPGIILGLLTAVVLHLDDFWTYLIGGLVGFGVLFLIALIAPGSMGMGDAKLILFLGLITGFPEILAVLFIAFVVGGITAGVLLALKKIDRKDPIAFGPFLALAGFIVLLYGNQILNWWTRMASG